MAFRLYSRSYTLVDDWENGLRSHQKEVGLIPYINNYATVQEFVRKLWTLSYISTFDVIKLWDKYILPSKPVYKSDNDKDDEVDIEEDNADKVVEFVLNCIYYYV